MENLIMVNRPIFCPVREIYLNKGVKLQTDLICKPMVLFLCERLEDDGYCLVGDIGSLLRKKAELEKPVTKQKYELGKLSLNPNK